MFPLAKISYRRQGNLVGNLTECYLAIFTNSIRWKPVNALENPPICFSTWRGTSFLQLEFLQETSTWTDVEDVVKEESVPEGPAVVIPLKSRRAGHLVIIARTSAERDCWLHAIRLRVTPARLLQERMYQFKLSTPVGISFESICTEILNFTTGGKESEEQPSCYAGSSTRSRGCFRTALDKLDRAEVLANTFKVFPEFVGTVAVVLKQFFKDGLSNVAENAEHIAETAGTVADISKAVSVFSSIFQVVALSMRIVAMVGEMKRGQNVLPLLRSKVLKLFSAVWESIAQLMHPLSEVHPLLIAYVFETQEKSLGVMGEIEDQLLRGKASQVWFSKALKSVESALDELHGNVMAVITVGEVVKLQIKGSRKGLPNCDRPRVASYFVGRHHEFEELKKILDNHSSAAIMRYGGVGKTQLMTAFVEHAEKNGWIPGGDFWISAHGDEAKMLSSLALLTESLTGWEFRKEERGHTRTVLSTLKQNLRSLDGKWILCIDCADSPDVNKLLADVCGMLEDDSLDGWILVSSRQGGVALWDGMMPCQKLKIEPLRIAEAMVVLWRWKSAMPSRKIDHQKITAELKNLQLHNPKEYQAISKLAAALGGLPLALAQAGSYIFRSSDSFETYALLFEQAKKAQRIEAVFRDDEESAEITAERRTIWTTWRINVDSLDVVTRRLIRSFSFFDSSNVPEPLVLNLNPKFATDSLLYREVVRDGMETGGSLLEKDGAGSAVVFRMHRLVRDFVLSDAKHDQLEFSLALSSAIRSMHICVKDVLRASGGKFDDPPWTCNSHTRPLLVHCLSIIEASWDSFTTKSFCETGRLKEVIELYRFCIRALHSNGRLDDASTLCGQQHRILMTSLGVESDHRDIIVAMHDEAYLKMEDGDIDDTGKLLEKCRAMTLRLFGNDVPSPEEADTIYILAMLAEKSAQSDRAKQLYLESLKIWRKLSGDAGSKWKEANILHQLGNVALMQDELAESEELYLESLSLRKSLHSEQKGHQTIALSLRALGNVALGNNNLEKAEDYCKRCLDMTLQVYGSDVDHPDVASALYSLGTLARMKAEYQVAQQKYDQCLAMRKRLYGEEIDHISVASCLHAQAILYETWGNLEAAFINMRAGVKMYIRVYSNNIDHPTVNRAKQDFSRIEAFYNSVQ